VPPSSAGGEGDDELPLTPFLLIGAKLVDQGAESHARRGGSREGRYGGVGCTGAGGQRAARLGWELRRSAAAVAARACANRGPRRGWEATSATAVAAPARASRGRSGVGSCDGHPRAATRQVTHAGERFAKCLNLRRIYIRSSCVLFVFMEKFLLTIQLLSQFVFDNRILKSDIFDHPTFKTVHN
jgi:hypothetical protein